MHQKCPKHVVALLHEQRRKGLNTLWVGWPLNQSVTKNRVLTYLGCSLKECVWWWGGSTTGVQCHVFCMAYLLIDLTSERFGRARLPFRPHPHPATALDPGPNVRLARLIA